jgi:HK97 gp10 family phage protein
VNTLSNLVGVSVVGDREVMDILTSIAPREARNLARATVHGIASRITRGAKSRVKVDSGTLKKSIYTKRDKSPPDRPVSTVRFKDAGFYWRFVEYGTSRRNSLDARPFLKPAKQETMANINTILREEFQAKLTARLNKLLRAQARR